jgi:aerobic-type carbon monoxide dehydrogenase small subunit (CoxS/CutS family)
MPMAAINVNGQSREVDVDPSTPLLYVLRDHLQLNGAKYGCGLGQCGSCTVIADGEPIFSCLVPVSAVLNRRIRTLEGLGTEERPGPVQRAFVEEQAAQCGYCIPGMIVRAQALLERNPEPTRAQILRHLAPNLCRCGTHMRIVRAVESAVSLHRRISSTRPPTASASRSRKRSSTSSFSFSLQWR